MGAELFDARPDLLISQADEVLGWSLRDVCLDGPIELLTSTDRAQPALFALAYVLFEALSERLDAIPSAAAGHSLGEYTAFAAGGAFSFEDGLRLVSSRGTAMAAAAAAEPSAMAALLGVDEELAESIAAGRREEGGRLWVANLNAPGQVVLAGATGDIEWLIDSASDLGVRRAVALNVAGAFHSPLMESAVGPLDSALAATVLHEPRFAVWANVSGLPAAFDEVRDLLARQVVSPVRFSATLSGMAGSGIDTFIHVGPGDVTAGMAKRAAPGTTVLTANDLDSVARVAEQVTGL